MQSCKAWLCPKQGLLPRPEHTRDPQRQIVTVCGQGTVCDHWLPTEPPNYIFFG